MKKRKVLVTDYIWPNLEPEKEVLKEINGKVIEAKTGEEEELTSLAADADAIITCFAKVSKKVIRNATNCKIISRYGIGIDNIDVEEATNQKIPVTNVPDYCIDEVSNHVLALLLALTRNIIPLNEKVKQGRWDEDLDLPTPRLESKKLGIVGFGRIGQSLCKKAQGLNLKTIVSDPYVEEKLIMDRGAIPMDFDTLTEEADFISIHVPLNSDTRKLFAEKEFQTMKNSSIIINTARGPIIDKSALQNALENGQIAGAGLDVLPKEPPAKNDLLLQLDNVIITPHAAFYSDESIIELQRRAAKEVVRVLNGDPPDNLVNPEVFESR